MADDRLEAEADARAALKSVGDEVLRPGCAVIVGSSSWWVLASYDEVKEKVENGLHEWVELSLLVSTERDWICRTTLRTRIIEGVQEIRPSQWQDFLRQRKAQRHMEDLGGGSGLMVVPGL